MEPLSPLELIDALRRTDRYIETIFTQGGCYQFHIFLKRIWPEAVPFQTDEMDHVVSLIGGKFYDITGEVEGDFHAVTEADMALMEHWSFSRSRVLSLGECPNCEEPLLV
jgi:hypothetical protein